MYLLLFLLVIVYFFFIRPYLRVRRVMKDAQRRAADFFGGADSPFSDDSHGQPSGKRHRSRPRKKIDSDVGEYIEFEEVASVTSYTYTETRYETEEQIEDADWEEIR